MKKKNIVLGMALLFMSLVSLELFAQKSVLLKYNVKEGERYQHVLNMENTIDMEVQGQETSLEQESSFEMTFTVKKVDADSITVEIVIDALSIKQSIMGMEIVYDSRDSSTFNSPMVGTKISDEMNKMIGEKIVAVMDKYGHVGSVDMGNLQDKNMAENFKDSFSSITYPEKKMKVGDSWVSDVVTGGLAEMKQHITYTLASIKGKEVHIQFQGTLEGVNPSDKVKGSTSGEIVVNRKTGWMIKKESTMDYDMEMEQQGMSFPASISSEYEVEVKKL